MSFNRRPIALVKPTATEHNLTPFADGHRAPLEEAAKQYLEDRSWMKLMGYGQERARALGITTEEDIDRLIAESRSEQRARIVLDNEALRSVRSSD